MTDIGFTYGGVTVGRSGDSSYHLVDRYTFDEGVDSVSVAFTVVVQNDSEATFVSKESALVTAYTTPHGTLSVVLGTTTRHTYSPSAGTGFNARPLIRKLGQDEDTGRSAKYECSVTLEKPATLYSANGRRSHSMTVAADTSGVRTVSFQGEWTRATTTDARAQYDAQIASFVATQLAALDNTVEWELLPHQSTNDDRDNVVEFQRVYKEILLPQSLAGTDNTSIKDAGLSIQVTEAAPGDSPVDGLVARLTEIQVNYTTSVDKDQTSGTSDLKTLYDSVIRPLILSEVSKAVGGRPVAVVTETYGIDPTSNQMNAALTLNADSGGTYLSYARDETDDIIAPFDLDPVWDGSDYGVDVYHVPGTWIKTVTRTALYVAGRVPTALKDQQVRIPGFVQRRHIPDVRITNLGRHTDTQLPLVLERDVRIFQRADIRTGANSGGGVTRA